MPNPSGLASNGAQQDEIVEELRRILDSRFFKGSKRCTDLLQYVVSETVDGRGEYLKERTIGIAAFGRAADYDTATDSVVRSSAVEVRKHLAQYYDTAPAGPVRIRLTTGSYVPSFVWEEMEATPVPGGVPPVTAAALERPPAETEQTFWPRYGKAVLAGASICVLALALAAYFGRNSVPDSMQKFWGPLLVRRGAVILAAGAMRDELERAGGVATLSSLSLPGGLEGQSGQTEQTSGTGLTVAQTLAADSVGFADALALARVAVALNSSGAETLEIRRAGSLSLSDLTRAPAVLVGSQNNPWVVQLEAKLRFRYIFDKTIGVGSIVDQQSGKTIYTAAPMSAPYSTVKTDRAIISRFVEPLTEQHIIMLAGLGRNGTIAAGEFVSREKYLEMLDQSAPSGWEAKNLQVVVEVDIVRSAPGPPRIVAIHVW
ncbi:MAG: hypothetical protein IT169_05570 [Bryobacterales bacterium]|nr:hypothetical protein [Bryobacterales bacterium]